jgi:hypothetical protein
VSRPLQLLLASVKALLLLAAVGVPIYIFVTSQRRSTHESTPRRPAAVTVPLIDDGFRDPASWVDASGSSTRLRTSMHDDSLVLPAPARSWRAVYLSPERTAGWRDYRVRMRVERLGPAGSGANATLLLGSGGGLAITVSAAVVRVSDRTGTRSRQLALDAFEPAASHELEATVLGRKLGVKIDGGRGVARSLVVPAPAVRGGMRLGVWRERRSSTRPRFPSLSVSPAAPAKLS